MATQAAQQRMEKAIGKTIPKKQIKAPAPPIKAKYPIMDWKNLPYASKLDGDQTNEILLGLEEGMTDEQVKSYFKLPADQMKPAMSITGSGAHGIIATMPLYAAYKVNGYTEEQLLRATALSYLVCMYIKEYSGRLSAFCGCAIAAGSGMACALVYLRGGTVEMMAHTLNNMASSITGMICDGGNQGCTMKGVAAVDAAYKSVEFAMNGIYISEVHGINGNTPEETMRNMGLIASPGMVGTEKTIVEIFEDKLKK